jgi:prepilin-type N-terminal cleavage/methylation domain-containing protein
MQFKVKNSKCKIAFTLIELLVVVVVILILAALLLPVLASARAKSLRMECLNNLRQVDLLLLMYGHDNNDRLPSTTNMLVLPPPAVDAALRGRFSHQMFYDPARVAWDRAHPFMGSPPPDVPQAWFDSTYYPYRKIGYYLTLPGERFLHPTNVNATILPQPILYVTGANALLPPPKASERALVAGGVWPGPGIIFNAHVDSKGLPLGDNVAMLDGSAKWRKFKDMSPRTRIDSGGDLINGVRW